MPDLLATMYTFTTYGTWLRGDERGWVEDGIPWPPNPYIEENDRRRMKHEPFLFDSRRLLGIGTFIGNSLRQRLGLRIAAMTVQVWHVHFIVGPTDHLPPVVAKCAKDAVRWGLRVARPIWTDGYDKRFCFDDEAALARMEYVEKHNTVVGLPARPWDFINPFA
jgi:hypothetical protein